MEGGLCMYVALLPSLMVFFLMSFFPRTSLVRSYFRLVAQKAVWEPGLAIFPPLRDVLRPLTNGQETLQQRPSTKATPFSIYTKQISSKSRSGRTFRHHRRSCASFQLGDTREGYRRWRRSKISRAMRWVFSVCPSLITRSL